VGVRVGHGVEWSGGSQVLGPCGAQGEDPPAAAHRLPARRWLCNASSHAPYPNRKPAIDASAATRASMAAPAAAAAGRRRAAEAPHGGGRRPRGALPALGRRARQSAALPHHGRGARRGAGGSGRARALRALAARGARRAARSAQRARFARAAAAVPGASGVAVSVRPGAAGPRKVRGSDGGCLDRSGLQAFGACRRWRKMLG
jgi:hypothetical protein